MGSRTRTSDGGIGDQYSLHTIEMGYKKYNELLNNPIYSNTYSYLNGYTSIESNNIIPELNVPNSNFSIPKETPFLLELEVQLQVIPTIYFHGSKTIHLQYHIVWI